MRGEVGTGKGGVAMSGRTEVPCPECPEGTVMYGATARRASCDSCGTTFNVQDGKLERARQDYSGAVGMTRRGWAGDQG